MNIRIILIMSLMLFIVFSSKPANSSENSVIDVELDSSPIEVNIVFARHLMPKSSDLSDLRLHSISKELGTDIQGLSLNTANGDRHILVCSKGSEFKNGVRVDKNKLILRESRYYPRKSDLGRVQYWQMPYYQTFQISDVSELKLPNSKSASSTISYEDCIKEIKEILKRQDEALANLPEINPILRFKLTPNEIRTDGLVAYNMDGFYNPSSSKLKSESTGQREIYPTYGFENPIAILPRNPYLQSQFGSSKSPWINSHVRVIGQGKSDDLKKFESESQKAQ